MRAVGVFVATSLTACSFAPPEKQPPMPIPAHYKEAREWRAVSDDMLLTSKTPWWARYKDHTLNTLEQKISCHNQPLKIALAQFQEASALAQVVRSALYPTVLGIGNASRQQLSTNVATSAGTPITRYNAFFLGPQISYELDAWGRVRNAVTASNNLVRASAFDLATMELSMRAELANDYFTLRGLDEAQRVLDSTVRAYKKAFYLTRKRYDGGASPILDVLQAKTQLESAKTYAIDMQLQRATLEHAIAVLVGEIPANFSIAPTHKPFTLVTISPRLPSTLLVRRPDIAAALLRVKSANASIGVARAAFFPDINLMGILAGQSSRLSNLFSASSLFWSLGPPSTLALVQPMMSVVLFDGYQLQGLLKHAKARYFETVSHYRQTVLTAFQQVEDNLVAIRRLDQELQTQTAAM
ncbi:MAG TPA: transporter, partial [Legionella sp.]|nr:transporter [Legionella sp.]